MGMAAQLAGSDLGRSGTLKHSGAREGLLHPGRGTCQVELSSFDACHLRGGVDVERILLGSETEAVSSSLGSAVVSALAARTATAHADLVLFLQQQVLQGGRARGRAVKLHNIRRDRGRRRGTY